MRFRFFPISVAVLCSSLIFGCGILSLDDRSDEIRDLIERNHESWDESDVENYSFSYDKRVGDSETNDVDVTVIQGEIDSVSVAGVAVDSTEGFLTVDRLYDELVRNFERDDRGRFRVDFNEEFSYPRRYRMLPGEATEGRGVVVQEFGVLGDNE